MVFAAIFLKRGALYLIYTLFHLREWDFSQISRVLIRKP